MRFIGCVLVSQVLLTGAGGAAQPAPGPTVVQAAVSEPRTEPVRDALRRAVFVVGDSTVKNHGPGEGWGDWLAPYFDGSRVQVLNWAMGGQRSRSFIAEGRWQKVLAQMRPGDIVLIQFGHNDQRELTTDRGTIAAIDDSSQEVINETTKKPITVRTYGWYLRQCIRDARAKEAKLILLSPVPRNYWTKDGVFDNAMWPHSMLMQQIAEAEGVPFLDMNARLTRLYTVLRQFSLLAENARLLLSLSRGRLVLPVPILVGHTPAVASHIPQRIAFSWYPCCVVSNLGGAL